MFEWDEAKNRSNIEKHGVSFELASEIFAGVVRSEVDARADYGEVRRVAIGVTSEGLYLTVVHTVRNGRIRVISARRAGRLERERYDEEIRKSSHS